MEIIRPSESQLILKSYGNMRKVVRQFAIVGIYYMPMVFIFCTISSFTPINLSTSFLIALFPYIGIGCLSIAVAHDCISIFDLDLQAVRVERYWILFRKRQVHNHDLANIKNIVVAEDNEYDWYSIILKQYSGEDIQISYSYFLDRSIVEASAQTIREFLVLKLNL